MVLGQRKKLLNESNKEIEKAFPRKKTIQALSVKRKVKIMMLLCLPLAIFIDAASLGLPAFIISALGLFIPED